MENKKQKIKITIKGEKSDERLCIYDESSNILYNYKYSHPAQDTIEEKCAQISEWLVNNGYCRKHLNDGTIIKKPEFFDERWLPKKSFDDCFLSLIDKYNFPFKSYSSGLGGPVFSYICNGNYGINAITVWYQDGTGTNLENLINDFEGYKNNVSVLNENLTNRLMSYFDFQLSNLIELKSKLEELFSLNE